MLAFTLRRAIQAIGVLIAVGIISFSMFRFAGDPVNQIVSLDTSSAEREAVRKSLGLDDPVPLQFAAVVASVVLSMVRTVMALAATIAACSARIGHSAC